jgi:hypothetical protein
MRIWKTLVLAMALSFVGVVGCGGVEPPAGELEQELDNNTGPTTGPSCTIEQCNGNLNPFGKCVGPVSPTGKCLGSCVTSTGKTSTCSPTGTYCKENNCPPLTNHI